MLHVIVVRHDGTIAQQTKDTDECVSVAECLNKIARDPEIKAALMDANRVIRIYDGKITVDQPDFFEYLAGNVGRRPPARAGAQHCIRVN